MRNIYIYILRMLTHIYILRLLTSSVMEVKLINPPQMSHTCGTPNPCQSAQISELVSMRNIYIYIYIYITSIVTGQK